MASDAQDGVAGAPEPHHLDLRGTPCPLNYIRTKLALESLPPGGWLQVDLDRGEPELMVAEGLAQAGHRITAAGLDSGGVRLSIWPHGA